jgi:D-alanyl-D-alanine dipeptidase
MTSERALLVLAAVCVSACAPAAAAAPPGDCSVPAGEELVNVRRVDRTIRVDLRYATPNNFTGRRLPGYDAARALLHPDAAAALARVQARLRTEGLGLKIFDAYRPIRATLAMVDWAERSGNTWVLDQGYVARQSNHNRGNTVDLTLVSRRSGNELAMGTPFDTFSPAAHTANATGAIRDNRMRLKSVMEAEGFENYDQEWWHYTFRSTHPPLDIPISCVR